MLDRSHEHIAAHHKRHLLAIGRHASVGCPTAKCNIAHGELLVGVVHANLQSLRGSPFAHGVKLTIIAKAEQAVARHREIAHGVLLKSRNR